MLREHFIEQKNLPWPGPSATALLIIALQNGSQNLPPVSREDLSLAEESMEEEQNSSSEAEPQAPFAQSNEIDWEAAMSSLLRGATASGIIVWLFVRSS